MVLVLEELVDMVAVEMVDIIPEVTVLLERFMINSLEELVSQGPPKL